MKTSLLLALGMIASLGTAHAADLNLACVSENTTGDFKVRQIIITPDHVNTAQGVATKKKKKASDMAIVIEIIPGAGMEPATESQEFLSASEFSLSSLSSTPDQNRPLYRFEDKKNGDSYLCEPNGDVDAQPALSRS